MVLVLLVAAVMACELQGIALFTYLPSYGNGECIEKAFYTFYFYLHISRRAIFLWRTTRVSLDLGALQFFLKSLENI